MDIVGWIASGMIFGGVVSVFYRMMYLEGKVAELRRDLSRHAHPAGKARNLH